MFPSFCGPRRVGRVLLNWGVAMWEVRGCLPGGEEQATGSVLCSAREVETSRWLPLASLEIFREDLDCPLPRVPLLLPPPNGHPMGRSELGERVKEAPVCRHEK